MPILALAENEPPPPTADPRVHALHAYWSSIRRKRRFPARSDFDPIDIPALLPYLWLADVRTTSPRFVYRLVGTKVVELLMREVTGLPVGTGVKPEELDSVIARYTRVADDRIAIYQRHVLQEKSNDYTGIERLLLPMGERDEQVDIVLGIVVRIN